MAFVFLSAGYLYWWHAPSVPRQSFSREPTEAYQLLTKGLLAGHLYVAVDPTPGLVALANPYDPVSNVPYRVSDLSFFNRRYYLYLSVTPAIAFFAPLRLLTGLYPSEDLAVRFFCIGGLLFNLLLLRLARERYQPHGPFLLFACSALSLALATGYFVVLRGVIANHVPIAAGYGFASAAFYFLARSYSGNAGAQGFKLFGLFLGFAVSCRPNYLFAALAVLATTLFVGWAKKPLRARWAAFSGTLCFFGVMLLLVIYNYERFSNPLEFGARYMLGAWDQSHLQPLSTHGFTVNVLQYLAGPVELHRFFPFVLAPNELSAGVLRTVPFLWLAPFSWGLLMARRQGDSPRPAVTALLIFAALSFLVLTLLPSGNEGLTLNTANRRYDFDFLPWFVQAIALSVVCFDWKLLGRGWLAVGSCLVVGLSLASWTEALSLDFQVFPVQSYLPLARILNWPSALYESLSGQSYGAVSIVATFPNNRTGTDEPLVEARSPEGRDVVFVRYLSGEQVAFGYRGSGAEDELGSAVAANPAASHRIEVSFGDLYPADGHPAMKGIPLGAITVARRQVRVLLDRALVLNATAPSHLSAPLTLSIGSDPAGQGGLAPAFTGRFLSVGRVPLSTLRDYPADQAKGPIEIKVRFPIGRTGAQEPIVVTGEAGAGDFVYVKYVDAATVVFGFDHWGHPGFASKPVALDFRQDHIIKVDLDSLGQVAHSGQASKGSLAPPLDPNVEIQLDAKVVLRAATPTYPTIAEQVAIGRNPIGGSSCGTTFTGTILSVIRAKPGP